MNILLVNKSWKGGAANACIRLHLGLLNSGVASRLLLLDKGNLNIPETYSFYDSSRKLFIKKVWQELWLSKPWRSMFKPKIQTGFHSPCSVHDITRHPLYQWAGIVHLHWVSHFLDYPSFFHKKSKPLVWTLHDIEPMTGGYHVKYGFPEKQYKSIIARHLNIKKKACADANLTLISPSLHMDKLVAQSELFAGKKHVCIPNSVDMSVFKPGNKESSRAELGIPTGKKAILFVAESVEFAHKGMHLLLKAFQLSTQQEYVMMVIGKDTRALNNLNNIYPLGFVNSDEKMARVYSAADLFVIPSLEDNLPNTVLESLACGTPVVGFNTGGIPDMIIDGKNGFLAEQKNVASLKAAIEKSLTTTFDKEEIRKDALSRFDLSVQANSCISLYQSLLN